MAFSNVGMVHAVMPSPKDGIAAPDGKIGRSPPKISQRCATIKSVVAIIVAAPLVAAISLDMVAGRAAAKELDFTTCCGEFDSLVVSRDLSCPVGCASGLTTRYSVLLLVFHFWPLAVRLG